MTTTETLKRAADSPAVDLIGSVAVAALVYAVSPEYTASTAILVALWLSFVAERRAPVESSTARALIGLGPSALGIESLLVGDPPWEVALWFGTAGVIVGISLVERRLWNR
jgi:hypothetical protein